MFIIHFLYPAIAIILIWLISKVIYITFIKKRFDFKRELVNLLHFISLMAIIGFTIFPVLVITNPRVFPEFYVRNNFIPFSSIYDLLTNDYYMVPLKNILGNILLFMPFGFILILKFKRVKNMLSVALLGLLISLIIEVIQLNIPNRAFDIDDIILNTLGTTLGFLMCKIIRIENLFRIDSTQKQIN